MRFLLFEKDAGVEIFYFNGKCSSDTKKKACIFLQMTINLMIQGINSLRSAKLGKFFIH